jgi:CHAT domain-containing protein
VHDSGGDRDLEWQIESRMGHVLRTMGRNEDALEHYRESIAGIERLRSVALNTEQGRAGVLAKSHNTYAETADLLVDMHRDAEAFATAERGRARAFLEMLALARHGLPDDLTPEQKAQEKVLLEQASVAQKALWKEGLAAKDEEQHRTELRRAEANLQAFHIELRQENPRYASVRYPEPVDVSNVQKDLLDSKTVLVEFLLGSKRSLIWVITRDSVTVQSLPPRQQIEAAVAEYRRLLDNKASFLTLHSSLENIALHGTALYRTLLGPIRQAIPAGSSLIIIPDGPLNYLPFETLVIGSKRDPEGDVWPIYQLEQNTITYAPSASALLAVRTINSETSRWDKTLLAFGDPVVQFHRPGAETGAESAIPKPTTFDLYTERGFSITRLPFTREEVLGIARLFPLDQRRLYLGPSARASAIKDESLNNNYRYIHFATHALIDETAPDRSGIVFSPDSTSQEIGVLQSGDIVRLRLNADLVTLSACSTGLGQMINGEGVLGLTRAFFYAGARNVTVSLWNVNDSATSSLMKGFYTRLNEGAPKAEALRRAKLRLLNGSNLAWRNPYFWGAFVLVGYGK